MKYKTILFIIAISILVLVGLIVPRNVVEGLAPQPPSAACKGDAWSLGLEDGSTLASRWEEVTKDPGLDFVPADTPANRASNSGDILGDPNDPGNAWKNVGGKKICPKGSCHYLMAGHKPGDHHSTDIADLQAAAQLAQKTMPGSAKADAAWAAYSKRSAEITQSRWGMFGVRDSAGVRNDGAGVGTCRHAHTPVEVQAHTPTCKQCTSNHWTYYEFCKQGSGEESCLGPWQGMPGSSDTKGDIRTICQSHNGFGGVSEVAKNHPPIKVPNTCPAAVDGGWSDWGKCSATCGKGAQLATCTNPAPQQGGKDCSGNGMVKDPYHPNAAMVRGKTQTCMGPPCAPLTPCQSCIADPNKKWCWKGSSTQGPGCYPVDGGPVENGYDVCDDSTATCSTPHYCSCSDCNDSVSCGAPPTPPHTTSPTSPHTTSPTSPVLHLRIQPVLHLRIQPVLHLRIQPVLHLRIQPVLRLHIQPVLRLLPHLTLLQVVLK